MGFGKNRVMSLPDAVAQVLEDHIGIEQDGSSYPPLPDEDDVDLAAKQFDLGLAAEVAHSVTPDICPVCGNVTFVNIEGCKKCFSCGHSEC
jgi:ribonucleoside-diphosphate reductase alpha chain